MSRYLTGWIEDKPAAYLDRLVRLGLYGEDEQEVISTLLLEGIRRAVEKGVLPLIDFDMIDAAAVVEAPKQKCEVCDDGAKQLKPEQIDGAGRCKACGCDLEIPF